MFSASTSLMIFSSPILYLKLCISKLLFCLNDNTRHFSVLKVNTRHMSVLCHSVNSEVPPPPSFTWKLWKYELLRPCPSLFPFNLHDPLVWHSIPVTMLCFVLLSLPMKIICSLRPTLTVTNLYKVAPLPLKKPYHFHPVYTLVLYVLVSLSVASNNLPFK